jgi:nicotinamide-nucleotide amidase
LTMFPKPILKLATEVLANARAKGWKIATAESCTGGLVAGALTEIAGSSDVFERGFVTYSNEAKTELLGVAAELIAKHGAVSKEVALAMAEGALRHSRADLSVSITGIAGPGGGSREKPVGLVHIAAACSNRARRHEEHRFGALGRAEVRTKSVEAALGLLLREL